MINIPVLRWGKPYTSLDVDTVVHFQTGEELAKVSQANPGLVQRDMRRAQRARDVLREIPIGDLISIVKQAAELYRSAELPLGDGSQTPEQFVYYQSATTGLPEHMCRSNMEKNYFVLAHMEEILDALTRGLRSLDPESGLRSRGARCSAELSSRVARPRFGSAFELPGCSHFVAAGDSSSDRLGVQAGASRSLDSVSHVSGFF